MENVVSGTANTPTGPLEWVEIHGVDAATLEAHVQELGGRGFRLTSLSLSGTPAAPVYQAVLVKQEGPRWDYVLGANLADLDTALTRFAQDGLHPTQIVAVAPVGTPAVYAARVEEMTTPTKWGAALTNAQFSDLMFPDSGAAPVLLNFDFYHDLNSVAAVWSPQSFTKPFSLYWGQALADARTFNAMFAGVRYRRAFQTVGDAGYSTVWTGDAIPGQRDVEGLTEAEWVAALENARAEGLVPLYAQSNGSGSDTVYVGSFGRALAPVHEWTVTGSTATPELAAFDEAVKGIMVENGIRAATFAVGYHGRLVVARGYTWAEPGYPVTQATTTMRIASVSKPVTTVAIHQLIQEGKLTYDTPVQSILNLQTPSGAAPTDPRFQQITIGYLLDMLGGWDAESAGTYDPMFYDATIAAAFGAPLPVTKYMIASYMAGQPLDFDPGTQSIYSNLGFSLLGQVIERLRPGFTYTDAVKETIWKPLGVTRPFLALPLQGSRQPGEAEYQEASTGIVNSVMTPDQPLVPLFYGGENVTNMDSHGGWVLAACDYVKMLTSFDDGAGHPLLDEATQEKMFTKLYPNVVSDMTAGWYVGPLPDAAGQDLPAYNWAGLLDSDSSIMVRRADGLSMVLLTNQGTSPSINWPQTQELNRVANTITDWGTQDLFPSVGIPSF